MVRPADSVPERATPRSLDVAARSGAVELLAPAGTMDAFKAALAAGADAIYCGLGAFNARRNAENFSLETFEQACRLAHLAGSRVYVTMNILIREDELAQALAQVRSCHVAGADGFIFQDWGLLRLVRELWPQIECHLSTQANVHDPAGVRFAVRHGCSRVTLSRELSLGEIEACSGQGAELEVFGHGALCVSYSGECLLSSMQRGKSANRGLCRQPCRLPYRMYDAAGKEVSRVGGTRLLSPRDYCTIDDLPDLAAAGIGALKIEGRMKAPDYVASVVGAYRSALDAVACGGASPATPEVMRSLARAFNRDFTDCYLRGFKDNSMMSYERGNNRGQLAGYVVQARGRDVVVALDEPVGKGDLMEIRNPDKFDDYVTVPAPCDAEAPSRLAVKLPRRMGEGCAVRVIRSEAGMAAAREFASRSWPRKRSVDVEVRSRIGEPFAVRLSTVEGQCHPLIGDEVVSAEATGFTVEAARTRAVTAQEIAEHVLRLGTSPFEASKVQIEADEGAGMGFSAVHAVRAEAQESLQRAILGPWEGREKSAAPAPGSVHARPRGAKSEGAMVCALVSSPRSARAAIRAGADRVYAYADDLLVPESSGRRFTGTTVGDGTGSGEPWPEGTVPVLSEVSRIADIERLQPILEGHGEVSCGSIGWLARLQELGGARQPGADDVWLWNTVPLHNHAAFDAMREEGVAGAWLSPELSLLEIAQLAKVCGMGLGVGVLGHVREMTCEHCLLQSMGDCAKSCAVCSRRTLDITVRDEFDRPAIVTSDAQGRSRLWQYEKYDATPQIPELLDLGVSRFMVDCSLFDTDDVERHVRRAAEALAAALAGTTPKPRLKGATSGHLFERIG